jgi:tetratricopeptide (TPR) repeat protein
MQSSQQGNLSPRLSSFVGREHAVAELQELLGSARLLTLRSLIARGLPLARQAGDSWCIAYALFFHAPLVLWLERDQERAKTLLDEALAAARDAQDPALEAMLLSWDTLVRLALGDTRGARADAETALAIAASAGVPREQPRAFAALGAVSVEEGDLSAAREWFERAIAAFAEQDEPGQVMITSRPLMFVAVEQRDFAYARNRLRSRTARAAGSCASASAGQSTLQDREQRRLARQTEPGQPKGSVKARARTVVPLLCVAKVRFACPSSELAATSQTPKRLSKDETRLRAVKPEFDEESRM